MILNDQQLSRGRRISLVQLLKPKLHMCEEDKGWGLIQNQAPKTSAGCQVQHSARGRGTNGSQLKRMGELGLMCCHKWNYFCGVVLRANNLTYFTLHTF